MNLREFFERQVVRNRVKVYLYFQDQEIRVQGVFSHDFRSVIPAIHLAESGKYLLERMVTHCFPLEKAEKAVKVAGGEIEGKDPIKIVIVP